MFLMDDLFLGLGIVGLGLPCSLWFLVFGFGNTTYLGVSFAWMRHDHYSTTITDIFCYNSDMCLYL